MALKEAWIAELKYEAGLTKKILERVPMDKKDWKPHEKSMTLGALAVHVAEIPHWASDIVNIDEFDIQQHMKPNKASTNEELMKVFEEKLEGAVADLSKMNDEDFKKSWIFKSGEQIFYNTQKSIALRAWAFSHLFHHRGQLSVYLRLLDVPVPGMYGPSADERM